MRYLLPLVAAVMALGVVSFAPTQSEAGWRRSWGGPGVTVRVGPRRAWWGSPTWGPRVYAGPRRAWWGPRVYVGRSWGRRHWRRW